VVFSESGSQFNVNSEAGWTLGSIIDVPFALWEDIIQAGWLARRNIRNKGIVEDTDTFDFWWSYANTGFSQDNPVWAINLVGALILGTWPRRDPVLKQLARWCSAKPSRYWMVYLSLPLSRVSIAHAILWPRTRYGKLVRGLILMPRELQIRGAGGG